MRKVAEVEKDNISKECLEQTQNKGSKKKNETFQKKKLESHKVCNTRRFEQNSHTFKMIFEFARALEFVPFISSLFRTTFFSEQ